MKIRVFAIIAALVAGYFIIEFVGPTTDPKMLVLTRKDKADLHYLLGCTTGGVVINQFASHREMYKIRVKKWLYKTRIDNYQPTNGGENCPHQF